VVVIAQDAQGVEVARPWVEKAGGTYRTLLDQHNVVGKAYGLKYVPVGILVDEEGQLARPVSSVNIEDETFRQELTAWVETGAIPGAWMEAEQGEELRELTAAEREADARFQLAIALLARGKKEEAIAELRKAVRLDPQNWVIRKLLWAVETPEAFYDGNVDYGWQKRKMEKEAEELLGER